MNDYTVENYGSIVLVRPNNSSALAHLEDYVTPDALWFNSALATDQRYIADLVDTLREDGYTVD